MKNFDAINDALDVEASIVPVEETPKPVQKPKEKDDINKDYEYSRGNLYSLIEKGQEAVNGILELAQESDSARAYDCLLYTSPSPRDLSTSRMPSSA